MLLDFADPASALEYDADLCLIGAGVAGLTLADALRASGIDVLLLESGGRDEEADTQALKRTEIGGLPYTGAEAGRFRMYGGSSTRWGGQLLPLRTADYEARDFIPGSGWPITAADLQPHVAAVEDLMQVTHSAYDAGAVAALKAVLPPLDGDPIEPWFSKWSPWRHRNLAKTAGVRCEASASTRVLLHANVVEIVQQGAQVRSLRIKSLNGREGQVRARRFVVCTGAIETARLLLASGVGNQLVGRYFQDHLCYSAGTLAPVSAARFHDWFDPYFENQTMRSLKLMLSAGAQQAQRCLGVFGHVAYDPGEDSGFSELRRMLQKLQDRRLPLPSLHGVFLLARDAIDMLRLAFSALFSNRLRFPRRAAIRLMIDVEQAPNPDSRVELAQSRDALGVPHARLHWRVTGLEKHTVQVYLDLFRQRWERAGLGTAKWNEAVALPGDQWLASVHDTYHQAGTARMSDDPALGVVDRDLRVHGVDNLYVASTAVFPTSGSANPTFTMMCLCLRLAEHLQHHSGKT